MTGALAAWTGPLVMATVAAALLRADPRAPLLALLLLAAPLIGVLRPLARSEARGWSSRALITILVIALVLGAQLRFLADVARTLGVATHPALAVAALLVVLYAALRPRRWIAPLGGLALVAMGVPLIALALDSGRAPWTVWASVAARPALVFPDAGPWTRGGGRVIVPTTLTFTEEHRVTAVAPAVVRVIEQDGLRGATREWHLEVGDSLALRPGDRLQLDAGTRIRFEAGKRVPGVAWSGVAWADPAAEGGVHGLGWLVALTVTLVGGAAALGDTAGRCARRAAVGAPVLLLVLALAGVTWGLYAAYDAPDLTLGAPEVAAMARLPLHVLSGAASALLTGAFVAGLAGSFVAAALALAAHLAELIDGEGARSAGTTARIALAAALALGAGVAAVSGDSWSALVSGLGLAAAGLTAPALATAEGRARDIGAVAGALAFAVVAATARLTGSASLVGGHPALLAAPLAWLVARLAAPSASVRARRRAAAPSR